VKRPLKPDEVKIWGMVAATVHPMPGRRIPKAAVDTGATAAPAHLPPPKAAPSSAKPSPKTKPRKDLEGIEPNRRHRIAKAREEIGGRLDLHGLDQERARAVLEGFLTRAWNDGWRAVLVITGKGVQGDGILKRRAPEWLGAPHLAHIVAGISDAARHHGGAGALYVALKRKGRG
jgi:DNA-nicking Smr family endonuclease